MASSTFYKLELSWRWLMTSAQDIGSKNKKKIKKNFSRRLPHGVGSLAGWGGTQQVTRQKRTFLPNFSGYVRRLNHQPEKPLFRRLGTSQPIYLH